MKLNKCHGCGVVKDEDVLSVYPYHEEDHITDEPIEPFFPLDVEPEVVGSGFRRANVCFDCFHKLSPDMWIDERGWRAIGPDTPFDQLPRCPG